MTNSPFIITSMTTEHARSISEWNYPPPYNIYGWMPWNQMDELNIEFGDPILRKEQYASIINLNGELCGFTQFFPLEGVTRLGIGLHPKLCGQGMGALFVQSIVHEAKRRKPQDEIDLEVLTWNTRAIKAYQNAGFEITDTYERMTPDGSKPFYCMVYSKSCDIHDK